jgi:hypothetical protein
MTNYLTPVVAVLLGVLLVEERLGWNLVVRAAIVLLGVWIAEHNLVAFRQKPARRWLRQGTTQPSPKNAFASVRKISRVLAGSLV